MRVGTFAQDQHGVLHGKVFGLGFGTVSVMFDPQISKDGKEYYRLIADPANEAYEVGVAFPKEKAGRPYHSVSMDSPAFSSPINAALFADKDLGGKFNLIWSRYEYQASRIEANVIPLDKPEEPVPTPDLEVITTEGRSRSRRA